jgi:hypothetical protein
VFAKMHEIMPVYIEKGEKIDADKVKKEQAN